jgi:hypothetical protein
MYRTLGGRGEALTARRFPPPWTIEEYAQSCWIVRDNNRTALAYVYFEEEPGRRTAATPIRMPRITLHNRRGEFLRGTDATLCGDVRHPAYWLDTSCPGRPGPGQ